MPEGINTEAPQAQVSDTLVDRLQAIASPNRLRLLTLLREPRTVSDIELEATVDQGNPDRQISRQGVRHHLNRLREAGFVMAKPEARGGKRVHEYVTDTSKLYELGEILQAMPEAKHDDTGEDERDGNDELGAPIVWDQHASAAPTLTVVHGAQIGRSFPLQGEPVREGRGWIIGKDEDVDIPLPWDPYVDRQAGEIELREDALELVDLRATPHRVSLNGDAFRRGESRAIEDGDLVGVGRTLMCLRE